jgi:hypothetical protein
MAGNESSHHQSSGTLILSIANLKVLFQILSPVRGKDESIFRLNFLRISKAHLTKAKYLQTVLRLLPDRQITDDEAARNYSEG